jgi:hypothetical protein
MQHRAMVIAGGLSFVVGALAFVSVFSYLAANFDYPDILDGSAAEVLPRLHAGGSSMRAIWAVYAFLPLLLVPGAVGAYFACPSSRGRMTPALVAASLGALAMFLGLNLYLGNYIGEFLGEICLGVFFLLAGLSLIDEERFPKWLGWGGAIFAALFLVGAFRNVLPAVQDIADLNNVLLPLWMVILGVSLVRRAGPWSGYATPPS